MGQTNNNLDYANPKTYELGGIMINGADNLMDPVGAFITLIFLELLIKARFFFLKSKKTIFIYVESISKI